MTDPPQIRLTLNQRPGSADWFDLQMTVAMDGEEVPFDELFVALTRGEEYLILRDRRLLRARPAASSLALRDLIEESKALHDHARPELAVNRFQSSLWDDLVSLGTEIDQSARWRRSVAALAEVTAIEPVAVPETLQAELRPYQLDGYRWLSFLWTHQLGGILADDMGLGKTLQALALICRARQLDARTGRRSWWWRRPAWCPTGRARPPGSPPGCAWSA